MGLLCNFVNVLFSPLGLASLILIIIIIIIIMGGCLPDNVRMGRSFPLGNEPWRRRGRARKLLSIYRKKSYMFMQRQ